MSRSRQKESSDMYFWEINLRALCPPPHCDIKREASVTRPYLDHTSTPLQKVLERLVNMGKSDLKFPSYYLLLVDNARGVLCFGSKNRACSTKTCLWSRPQRISLTFLSIKYNSEENKAGRSSGQNRLYLESAAALSIS